MKNIAILGFGRLGRLVFWQLYGHEEYRVSVIYDTADLLYVCKLLQYDLMNDQNIQISFRVPDIICIGDSEIIYRKINKTYEIRSNDNRCRVDILIDCTGIIRRRSEVMTLFRDTDVQRVIFIDENHQCKSMKNISQTSETEIMITAAGSRSVKK